MDANRNHAPPRAKLFSDEVVRTSVRTSEYQRRKEQGLCTRCGVELPADWEHGLCPEHHDDLAERRARSQAKRHEERREAGECATCGSPSETYRCPACLVSQNRAPRSGTDNGKDKATRIIEQTRVAQGVGNEGRRRYHGCGERGRRSIEEENRSDFDLIEKDLAALVVKICGSVEAARRGEAYVWSETVRGMPPVARRAAVIGMLDHAHVAYRLLGEILRRGKYPRAPQIADFDDDGDT